MSCRQGCDAAYEGFAWLDACEVDSPSRPDTKERWVAEEIRAEMVANVWKVVAIEGDEVEDGMPLSFSSR